jgi:positive regulator of sigma E activity
MKDSGFVVNTRTGFAEVEVHCLVEACQGCAAERLCVKQESSKGRLVVKNPLQASVGDEVEIEIPERAYKKALIAIFSILLLACLAGMGLGYLLSVVFSGPGQEMSIIGLFLALFLTGGGLFWSYRKKNKDSLYPKIIDILQKRSQE